MASFINKRQQARNERALQELIRNVPGNDRCADCMARNPGWASWNLGIFLCMRCAALHRKMGTHISKVKSLSMDTWTSDQVDSMKRTGNAASNRTFNPRNIKPTMPVDADEADSAMERFIREKYQHRSVATGAPPVPARHATGSTTSSDDHPPPLPPKTGSRFLSGLRSTSSQYPASGSSDGFEAPQRELATKSSSNNLRPAKSTLDLKLQQLQDMGFKDNARNKTVLKALDGNVQKAVEALVRLGESSSGNGITVNKSHPPPAASPVETLPTPTIQQQQQQQSAFASANQSQSTNPFPPSQNQTIQQYAQVQHSVSPPVHTNPFDAPATLGPNGQSYQTLQQSFPNLQVSAPPLFPHNTGNWQSQPPAQSNPFLASATPSVPSSYQYSTMTPMPTQHQPASQSHQDFSQAQANPFLRTSRSQNFASSNPFGQPGRAQTFDTPYSQNSNVFINTTPSPFATTIPQPQPQFQPHAQQSPIYQSPVQSPQPTGIGGNPFGSTTYPPVNMQQQPQQQNTQAPQFQQQFQTRQAPPLQQQQPVMPQQTGRFDKNSILALYSQPNMTPARPAALAQPSIPEDSEVTYQGVPQGYPGPLRSMTMPVSSIAPAPNTTQQAGLANPFSNLIVPGSSGRPTSRGHMSKESADVAGYMGGRHSPDAFAGLSARAGR